MLILPLNVEIEEKEETIELTKLPATSEERCPQPMASTISYANCRSGPGTAYNIAVGLKPDQEYMVIGKSNSGEWWQVERSANMGTCWIWTNLVDICGDTDDVKVVGMQEKDKVIEEEVVEEEAPVKPEEEVPEKEVPPEPEGETGNGESPAPPKDSGEGPTTPG